MKAALLYNLNYMFLENSPLYLVLQHAIEQICYKMIEWWLLN